MLYFTHTSTNANINFWELLLIKEKTVRYLDHFMVILRHTGEERSHGILDIHN